MERNCFRVLCLCAVALSASATSSLPVSNLLELISSEPELTDFHEYIESFELVTSLLRDAEVTLFAPTNHAFRKYAREGAGSRRGASGQLTHVLVYHVAKSCVTPANFPAALASELPGGLPVWVTQRANASGSVWHANNALIVRGDIKGESQNGSEQVLHVIDEVLEPYLLQEDDPKFWNPTAFRLMSNSSTCGISEELSRFYRKTKFFNTGSYGYHVEKILSRHLVVNTQYSRVDLLHTGSGVRSVRAQLEFFERNGSAFVMWEGRVAEVVEADVETENGMVHVIDRVLFKEWDMASGLPSKPTSGTTHSPRYTLLLLLLPVLLGRASG